MLSKLMGELINIFYECLRFLFYPSKRLLVPSYPSKCQNCCTLGNAGIEVDVQGGGGSVILFMKYRGLAP